MNTTNLVVVEMDPLRRCGIAHSLAEDANFNVVGVGGDFIEFMQFEKTFSQSPDVLIVNFDQCVAMGMKNLTMLRLMFPQTRIVALTGGENTQALEAALVAGVTALHPKNVDPDKLIEIVRDATRGIVNYNPSIVRRIKRYLMIDGDALRVNGLRISPRKQEVRRFGKLIDLSPLEYRVLEYLAYRQGSEVSTKELLIAVWGASPDAGGTSDQVKSCIKRLRRKIEIDKNKPRYIVSIRGQG